jgi:hypothetical protein
MPSSIHEAAEALGDIFSAREGTVVGKEVAKSSIVRYFSISRLPAWRPLMYRRRWARQTQMANKKTSSGGKAEASGSNYETLVATWYAHAVLLGAAAQPPFDLPADTHFLSFACQSDAPVDDVNAVTTDGGIVFVQAKRTVILSSVATSAFAGTLDQFVRQYQACAGADPKYTWSHPLDPARDRLVLATRSASSSKIIEVLPRLLRGLRDRSDIGTLRRVATSQIEQAVAVATETNLKRSWRAAYGKNPTAHQLDALLRLIWVQELDLESGKRDRKFVLEQFRMNLLEDPTQASPAFSELFKLAARLRAERSGADRATLPRLLADVGIRLTALPDFRADVAALRKWTAARLELAPSFTQLLEDDAKLAIERAVWPGLRDAADKGSLLLVGEPGAGKSGLTYRLATTALSARQDVVFLPVDILNIDTFSGLQGELGIHHSLDEVLANWPGSKVGLLIVDALDAARKPETQRVLRDVIARILRIAGSRWNVVASVRKYDLRQGLEWSRMFRGTPPVPAHADPEFPFVRQVSVARLNDAEVAQIAASFPTLQDLYSHASDKLRDLLQNIFNLHLLAELLHAGVAGSALSGIGTQSELMDSYWRHRIRRDDGKHDARETTLMTVINEMISVQMLRVLRADIRPKVDAEALVDLERHGMLRAEDQSGKPNEDALLFNHHVLFDYAVARLIFWRGRDAVRLVGLLRARRELALMLSPSLTLALSDAWNSGGVRQPFWNLAFALAQETGLPGVAQLVAPMVAAEQVTEINDLQPLIDALTGSEPLKSAAETVVHNLIGALFVRMRSGVPLTGPSAGPWMTFAARLAAIRSDRVMFTVRALIGNAAETL